ncbi:signal sequence binding protein [Neurospora intermedia]|uniref:Vacuolar protein sorting/targeting protein 10 n=1 Tax=Neurospora intermedia TaxID=5142 RepID=A0ABR3D8R8_NEUIN
MRVRGALQAAALLASALWAAPLLAKDHPTFKTTKLDTQPNSLNYFEGSDTILFHDTHKSNLWRSDDAGATWSVVKDIPDGKVARLYMHDFDSKRAFAITDGRKHYRTTDQGKTWKTFEVDASWDTERYDILHFHATDPDRIIFNGLHCLGFLCEEVSLYTIDDFETPAKPLRPDTLGCWWAKSSPVFTTGDSDLDKDRILCIIMGVDSIFSEDRRLVISDDFFKADEEGNIQEFEPNLAGDKPVRGVVNVAAVKRYFMVATTSANTDEMALFISTDTKKWQRAMFPNAHDDHDHKIVQEAYTVLESTNYSIQLNVMTGSKSAPMGIMFTSNYDGTYFSENLEYTNLNMFGHVDFEKIAGIQGIFLVNKVNNGKEVDEKPSTKKKLVSEITFDDGRIFDKVTADGKRIHLHSVTELNNVGRVFSSPAPGLVMANGNTGDYLGDYWEDANLYVSDDAGKTWKKALKGPHKYEFGDQGSILVAVRDSKEEDISEISYSLDHGENWVDEKLPNDLKIQPWIITTTPDSTGLQFVLIGKAKGAWHVIHIDFEGLHEDTCKESDMEEWHARVDKDGEPTCIMGHTQTYPRRKKDAKCFLKKEFKLAEVETKDCDCTDQDYECDYNFERNDKGICVSRGPIPIPEGACKDGDRNGKFLGTSGYRKIPGNTCKDTKETKDKYKDVERSCGDGIGAPPDEATGELQQVDTKGKFGHWTHWEKHYLERGESSSDSSETIIMRGMNRTVDDSGPKVGPIWRTTDHGKKWDKVDFFKDDEVISIVPHPTVKDWVFFLTEGKKLIYTPDRGKRFRTFEVPQPADFEAAANGIFPLIFHPDKPNWLIWLGKKCESKNDCYRVAYGTKDGERWETLARDVYRCEFTGAEAYGRKYANRALEQILCLKHEKEGDNDSALQLVSSNDWFNQDERIRLKEAKEFATMAEFIVVATEDTEKKTLRAYASLDGSQYSEAKFPFGFEVPHQHAYTVLDSSTHAVNLFVATRMEGDKSLGTILKSNSNGTSYVVSVKNVNCDQYFYVDFEKMVGLEGVALVNVVANPDAKSSAPKKLQTKITHNDGAQWAFLPTPKKDEFGKFPCSSSGTEKCALHIQGYTQRRDRGKTYSSEGAVGVMFGWGNVGDSLGSIKDADTFMTTDAGITWKRVKKGRWNWALGDQGSIIVLVPIRGQKTDTLEYSLDQGATWKQHTFFKEKVDIWDLTTTRSGNSQNFLIWGENSDGLFTTKIDFTKFTDHVCKYDPENLSKSDYQIFSPKHPLQPDGCLFGHVSQYLRKKPGLKCFNDFRLDPLYSKQNCTCTRSDFECDFNYELDKHGQCSLVSGLKPKDHKLWCKEHPDEIEYYEPTGFRRIPLTTCQGGPDFEKAAAVHPCPGHEDDFERKHRVSGIAIFFAVVLPVAAASAIGWWVYRHWDGKFGQIRLGEQGASTMEFFDADRPWVKYPVIALSAVVALAGAMPLVLGALWRTAKSTAERWGIGGGGGGRGGWSRLEGGSASRTFRTRDSFARGRGDYTIVDEDEGELLGEESDEEV